MSPPAEYSLPPATIIAVPGLSGLGRSTRCGSPPMVAVRPIRSVVALAKGPAGKLACRIERWTEPSSGRGGMNMRRREYIPIIALLMTAGLPPDGATAQSTLSPVTRRDLCVTNGVIAETTSGTMLIESASSRAIVSNSDGRSAAIRFRYLGPSANAKPLASGELRRQIGLKLRSLNQCNLLYVMWHIEPDSNISVSTKQNPGQSTHAACDAHGYTTIRPMAVARRPKPGIGEWHELRATLKGSDLTLIADGAIAWQGTLPKTFDPVDGPSGLRTDNARFEFTFLATPGSKRPAERCGPESGD